MTSADGSAYQRAQMVASLRAGGVRDERVLAAMGEIPRHLFVPQSYRHQAYADDVSINIGQGQTISQPRVVALMTEAAAVAAEDRVLEIGTGSGYQAAVLAALCRFVFTVERIPALARRAKERLDRLGVANVSVKVMDGSLGWRSQAPFDAIIITAAAPELPENLLDQLTNGGRLVAPVGTRDSQALWVAERRGGRTRITELREACFVPLIGRHGFLEES